MKPVHPIRSAANKVASTLSLATILAFGTAASPGSSKPPHPFTTETYERSSPVTLVEQALETIAHSATAQYTIDSIARSYANHDHVASFLAKQLPYALRTEVNCGIPAAASMTKAGVESRWGESYLTRAANNLFGIKKAASVLARGSIRLPTSEHSNGQVVRIQANFAAYRDFEESYQDFCEYLHSKPALYRPVTDAKHDAAAFLGALQRSRYQTDTRQQLVRTLRSQNIDSFTEEAVRVLASQRTEPQQNNYELLGSRLMPE